jgi:chemotaxis protein CheD
LEITTILGSCVSVCLWDSKLKMGGMNHFMMPFWNGDGLASPKYGNIAIEKLIFNLLYLGSERENLVAKVFGGAAVLNSCDGIFNIGERNIQIQEELLRQESIKVVAGSLGGTVGRKLIFETGTGLVKMKYISKTQTP